MLSSTVWLALLSAAILGFRHGFDYDHIAAITDITSLESSRRRALQVGLLYVVGHAATVALLASAVILFQRSLPKSIDSWAERAVGLTLLILGVYVLSTLFGEKSTYVPRSRAAILIDCGRWVAWKVKTLFGASDVPRPERTSGPYSNKSVFTIGIIHGLGAETPSQLLLFLLAANLGGVVRGFAGLGLFLGGLLVMNTIMTLSAVGLFGLSAAKPSLLRLAVGATAAYSVVVGSIFLFGAAGRLPVIGG